MVAFGGQQMFCGMPNLKISLTFDWRCVTILILFGKAAWTAADMNRVREKAMK